MFIVDNGPVETVDLPIEDSDFLEFSITVYQGHFSVLTRGNWPQPSNRPCRRYRTAGWSGLSRCPLSSNAPGVARGDSWIWPRAGSWCRWGRTWPSRKLVSFPIEKFAIFHSFPMKSLVIYHSFPFGMVIFHSYVNVYQRVYLKHHPMLWFQWNAPNIKHLLNKTMVDVGKFHIGTRFQ